MAATKGITPATRKAGTRVAGRVSEGGSVFVGRHADGSRVASRSRSREPPTQTAARWSLPLTLTGTQADSTEAPLGFFASRKETTS